MHQLRVLLLRFKFNKMFVRAFISIICFLLSGINSFAINRLGVNSGYVTSDYLIDSLTPDGKLIISLPSGLTPREKRQIVKQIREHWKSNLSASQKSKNFGNSIVGVFEIMAQAIFIPIIAILGIIYIIYLAPD